MRIVKKQKKTIKCVVDARWEPDKNMKIHEIVLSIEPKNVNKLKKIEGEIDDNIKASNVERSGARSVIVQATGTGDLLFLIESGIDRIFMFDDTAEEFNL